MNPIRTNSSTVNLYHLPTEQIEHPCENTRPQHQSPTSQENDPPAKARANLEIMPYKVTIGNDSFFTGVIRSRLNASLRSYLNSALTPDQNASPTKQQDGQISYVVNHHTEDGDPEELAVSVNVDKSGYLSKLTATRIIDKKVVIDAQFESKINRFATKLTEGIRHKIATQVENEMLRRGVLWDVKLASGEPLTIKRLSSENMKNLRSHFSQKPLQSFEREFIKTLIDEPLYLTHATPTDSKVKHADGMVRLLSRQSLLQRGIEFKTTNTTKYDIEDIASDDYVFFSLEAGDHLQKDKSRFGNKIFRFDFDQTKILQNATLHLVDPYTGRPPQVYSRNGDLRFEALKSSKYKDENSELIWALEKRGYRFGEATFYGPHMKLGLALSLIRICREEMPAEFGKEILQGESLNKVVNGLLRPMVMVPKHFFDRPLLEADI